MPRPVRLSDGDLELVEGACRHVADRCRQDLELHASSLVRVKGLRVATKLERIADRLRRLRET
jgi:hypothetical protein